MPEKIFAARDFLKALSEGTLKEALVVEGLVKLTGQNQDTVLFSEGESGELWTKIPVDMIEQIGHTRTVRHGEQEHPLVRLQLKEPIAEDNKEAAVFADLLRRANRNTITISIEVKCPSCGCVLASYDAVRESSSTLYVGAIVTISYTTTCYNKDYCGSGRFDWSGTVTSGKIIRVS